MIYYTNSKFDRVSRYEDQLQEFTDLTLEEIKSLQIALKSRRVLMDFELIAKLLDLMLLIVFFWKSKDEQMEKEFTQQVYQRISK